MKDNNQWLNSAVFVVSLIDCKNLKLID